MTARHREIKEKIDVEWWSSAYPSIFPSSKAIGCQWDCLFVCSLTPPKRLNLMSLKFRDDFPLGADGFRPKNNQIRRTVEGKKPRECTNAFSKASECQKSKSQWGTLSEFIKEKHA